MIRAGGEAEYEAESRGLGAAANGISISFDIPTSIHPFYLLVNLLLGPKFLDLIQRSLPFLYSVIIFSLSQKHRATIFTVTNWPPWI